MPLGYLDLCIGSPVTWAKFLKWHPDNVGKCSRMHFYCTQHSCGKAMFLHLSVILFTGGLSGRHPHGRHTHPPWAETPWVDTPWADTPPGAQTRTPSWADIPWACEHTPWTDTPPGRQPVWADTPLGRHPALGDGHCSGRYASYWNAFL